MDTLDKKILATLLFSVFATVTGVGIVVPLLPVYAYDLGASGIYIALIFGAFSISRIIFLPYFGRLSDQRGRKPFIISGLFAYALISMAFIFSKSVASLIIIRFFHGIASAMLIPVIQAYVADITPKGREGLTMGLHNMAMLFGLSLGPLMGGFIKDQFNLQASFSCMGILAIVGLVWCLFLLPPKASEKIARTNQGHAPGQGQLLDRGMLGLCVLRFAYVFCIGIIWGFVPIYANLKFSLSSTSIGVLIMMGILISGAMNFPMGLLADRMNRKLMVAAGGLIVSYAILSFEWADRFFEMLLASALFGIGGGICMPALMAMAALKGTQSGATGSVMAYMTMAHSLGMLSGALLGGMMMDLFKLEFAFPASALVMSVSIGLFLVGTYHRNTLKLP
jgi:MFS family permease